MLENDAELEILEELDMLPEPDDEAGETVDAFSGTEEAHLYDSTQNPFINSIFPVVFIDKNLRIVFANAACENLFKGFFTLSGNYFMDIFSHSLEMDEIKTIRQTILHGLNGYSWKGHANIKSRTRGTIQARVYLFPADISNQHPEIFTVMFDDVTEENKHLLRTVFLSLLEASKLKDNDTGKHITRVNCYAKRLARELYESQDPIYRRIDTDYIDNIGFLASMHDVGKIGTPDDILNKEGPLSEWEWSIMREHTINGGFILSTYPNPMAKDIALCHHEHWDGAGYPYKLEQDMIPLSSRIVAIADVYDALRMVRSYKPAFDHSTAMEIIMDEKGTHFDPSLLKVFSDIAMDFNDIFESYKD